MEQPMTTSEGIDVMLGIIRLLMRPDDAQWPDQREQLRGALFAFKQLTVDDECGSNLTN